MSVFGQILLVVAIYLSIWSWHTALHRPCLRYSKMPALQPCDRPSPGTGVPTCAPVPAYAPVIRGCTAPPVRELTSARCSHPTRPPPPHTLHHHLVSRMNANTLLPRTQATTVPLPHTVRIAHHHVGHTIPHRLAAAFSSSSPAPEPYGWLRHVTSAEAAPLLPKGSPFMHT